MDHSSYLFIFTKKVISLLVINFSFPQYNVKGNKNSARLERIYLRNNNSIRAMYVYNNYRGMLKMKRKFVSSQTKLSVETLTLVT